MAITKERRRYILDLALEVGALSDEEFETFEGWLEMRDLIREAVAGAIERADGSRTTTEGEKNDVHH